MISIADCVKDYQAIAFEMKPETAIKNIFLNWLYNEKTGKLSGIDRGNKSYEAFQLMKYLKKMRKATLEESIHLTKEKISEMEPYKTSEIIEELFIGWLGSNTSDIGGEHDVNIYQAFNKIKFFFRQLSVTEYILKNQE